MSCGGSTQGNANAAVISASTRMVNEAVAARVAALNAQVLPEEETWQPSVSPFVDAEAALRESVDSGWGFHVHGDRGWISSDAAEQALADVDSGDAIAEWQADNGSGYVMSIRAGAASITGQHETAATEVGSGGKYARAVALLMRQRASDHGPVDGLHRGIAVYEDERDEVLAALTPGAAYHVPLASWTPVESSARFFATGEGYDFDRSGLTAVVLHADSVTAFPLTDNDEAEFIGFGDFTITRVDDAVEDGMRTVHVHLQPSQG